MHISAGIHTSVGIQTTNCTICAEIIRIIESTYQVFKDRANHLAPHSTKVTQYQRSETKDKNQCGVVPFEDIFFD